jgi:TrmH family RNA methyltransferase
MIPLHKLKELPRSQRLRKIARLFGEAESRILATPSKDCGEILFDSEQKYLAQILFLLLNDEGFNLERREAFKEYALSLNSASLEAQELNRCLNSVKHLLLSVTGYAPADWDFIDTTGHLDPAKRICFPFMEAYLEDIRSPFNIGALFRAAESFGAAKIWLSSFCADPRHIRAERTAMGCIDILPWERLSTIDELAKKKEEGFSLFALETGGKPLNMFRLPQKGILICGSEELGVSPAALTLARSSAGIVTIPTYGAKGSLNVSVAFGIAMHAWAEFLYRKS